MLRHKSHKCRYCINYNNIKYKQTITNYAYLLYRYIKIFSSIVQNLEDIPCYQINFPQTLHTSIHKHFSYDVNEVCKYIFLAHLLEDVLATIVPVYKLNESLKESDSFSRIIIFFQ